MHDEQTRPQAVWGLWTFFTSATIGFVVFITGVFGGSPKATLAGAALMAFSTLVYLFIHFWTTSQRAFSEAAANARSQPKTRFVPVQRVRRQDVVETTPTPNFQSLVERTPDPTPAPLSIPMGAQAGADYASVVTVAAGGGQAPHHDKEYFVPAVRRRQEIVKGLPIVESILGPTEPVTSPDRPGRSRGQCSNCNTMLWAPTVRPIRLKCPRCSKVAWLEK